MEAMTLDLEMRKALEEKVANRENFGNQKYEYMSPAMVAREIGISDTTLRKII